MTAALVSFFWINETNVQTAAAHPIHLSVTEVNHNAAEKTLEISCKIFTDDFEQILSRNYNTKVDLTNPPDRAAMAKLINDYIQKRLTIQADGKTVKYEALGFEKDQDVVYAYFEAAAETTPKTLVFTNTLLYDLFDDQISLLHITVGGKRKSYKLDYPAKQASFTF